MIECSKTKPWGIHTRLEDDHCPRCGWEAPKPNAPEVQTERQSTCSHEAAA